MNGNLCFVDEKRCDQLSNLSDSDLEELLLEIEKFYLSYRDSLNLPSNLSFGCELEYEDLDRKKVDRYIQKNVPNWASTTDETLVLGGEIVSCKLYDEKKTWEDLKKVCEFLRNHKAIMDRNASGHIHIGAHILEYDCVYWRRFLKLYTVYENILFRFGYGDKLNARRKILDYAFPVSERISYRMNDINKVEKFYDMKFLITCYSKNLALNFSNVRFLESDELLRNTLEFRFPNGCDEEIIWQNNINAFSKMMLAAKSTMLDEEFLDYKVNLQKTTGQYSYSQYHKVNLKSALEFVDLVFDNNLDKVYFLRQYLKKFEETDKKMITVDAKRFIERKENKSSYQKILTVLQK